MKGKFYITTPIYYVNDVPHIGHVYTTVAADALARYKRLAGFDVHLLTGTDEHGQKVERAARNEGETPLQLADRMVERFRSLWQRLNISNDDFIRTTEERHEKGVKSLFMEIYRKGDIYLGDYEGWYCTPCETFWLESQLKDGNCPDCNRPTEWLKEKSYFFKISEYQDKLLKYYDENPDLVHPPSRMNEIVSFVKGGLKDLSISRTSFDWGVPIPIDPKHVIYVWFDALANYITAVGYPENREMFQRYWPADVHIIGKDILRFHAVYWPAFLMSAGLPLPRRVFGHGWWTVEGKKMSKSLRNVVDPNLLIDQFGADALRYFLLREVSFGLDGDFSRSALVHRVNSDLANDLGNLFHRVLTMVKRYFGGAVPDPDGAEEVDDQLKAACRAMVDEVERGMDQLAFDRALKSIWAFIGAVNKYVDETAPWALSKEKKSERLQTVIYNCAESLRIITLYVHPFMPDVAEKMWQTLGLEGMPQDQRLDEAALWDGIKPGTRTSKGDQLFPRIEEAEEPSEAATEAEKSMEQITFEEFKRLDLRAARVVAAERVEKSKKLVKIRVDLGGEEREVVAGISEFFQPEELVGKDVILVANLEPAKLMGIESRGMLLAADSGEGVVLATFDGKVKPGSKVR